MAKLIDLDGLAYFYGKIKAMLAEKLGKNDTAAAAIKDGAGNTISTTYASKADVSALLSTKLGVTATAYAATRDGAGNNIVDTYARKTDIPNITVDAELSSTSTNTVQNKIIKVALDGKLGKNDTAVNASKVNNLTVETSVPKNAKFTDTVYTHPSTHPASMITGLSTVATSGSYNDLTNKPTIPSAYTLPNATSSALGGVKIGSNISVADGTISITKSNVTSALGYTPPTSDTVYDNATTTTAGLMSASDKVKLNNIADNANNYIHPSTHPAGMITGLASVATSGSYNDLKDKPAIPTVPTKVSAFVNDVGYLTQHQSLDGYAKTSVANTWTAQQNFNDLMLYREKYTTYVVDGSDTPTTSTMLYTATGAFTLSLATLAGALSAGQSSVFTAYFAANADYTLTITNAGTIKYIGSASDVAITSAGLLLNIMMLKDNSGNLTSIVQASKLS